MFQKALLEQGLTKSNAFKTWVGPNEPNKPIFLKEPNSKIFSRPDKVSKALVVAHDPFVEAEFVSTHPKANNTTSSKPTDIPI